MNDAETAPSRRPQLAESVRGVENLIARWLCIAVCLGTLIRWLGRWHWMCEITTHFVVQATVLATIATLLLFLRRYWNLAGMTACLTLINAAEWIPFFLPASKPAVSSTAGESLIVVSANVYSRNRQSEDLYRWLKSSQADVIFISEVDLWWAGQIESWKADWPHQIVLPRPDNFGLALISRYRIAQSETPYLSSLIPAVECQIETPAGRWSVAGLHPLPPAGAEYSKQRNEYLFDAAKRIQQLPTPRVVLGDLNSSSSSPFFRDLLSTTGLQDSRQGFGWQPTWPAGNRYLRIPIDHCLVEPSLQVVSREVGPDIGSDHLPVRCQLIRSP